jgi:hypothetical protein
MPPLDEDWKLLLNLLPSGWEQQAVLSGASERLRGFASTADLLRTLLLHVGHGYSLRETVVRAKAVGMAQVSDVALMKRLQKAEEWLRRLCVSLLQESGWEMPAETRGYNIRALDGTLIKEPGRSGSLWRIHVQHPHSESGMRPLGVDRGEGGRYGRVTGTIRRQCGRSGVSGPRFL